MGTTSTDYGLDLACVYDLDPMMLEVTGRRLLAERVARRLTTLRGGCIDAPNDGYDLRDELSREVTNSRLIQIQSQIRGEVLKDEEIVGCTITSIAYENGTRTMRVSLLLEDGDGPFPLVLSIGDVSVSILEV